MSASIWAMSGADLSAALAHRAPAPQAVVIAYPGASASLQPILETIASLSRRDQAALMRAFRSAEQAAKPKRLTGGNTFRAWADFTPALTTARMAAIAVFGAQWYLNPDLCIKGRVPAAWASCKVHGRTSVCHRDMNIPTAQFWPGGTLPVGPDYAEPYAIDPSADVRETPARQRAERKASRAKYEAAERKAAPSFVLEHTPEDIDAREMESV